MTVDQCKECDCGRAMPIVNKHFYLCERKNKDRLAKGKGHEKRTSSSKKINRASFLQFRVSKPRFIKRISASSRYRTSSGELVSQKQINERYKETCELIDSIRPMVCEATGRTDLPLSHSHTISRKRCKDTGRTELIWDPDNIFLESMGASDSGHYIWEHGNLEQKKTLLNFERKLQYIKKHDEELYFKINQ